MKNGKAKRRVFQERTELQKIAYEGYLTLAMIAAKCGTTDCVIWQWLHGRSDPSDSNAAKLAVALGLTRDKLTALLQQAQESWRKYRSVKP